MDQTRQFQYQARSSLVLTQAQTPEEVTESRWHQPWSEPVRKSVIAAALIAPAAFLVQAIFQETVFVDKWFAPLSEPVRVKPAQRAALQQAYFAEPQGQTQPESVSEDKWHQAWSEPVRLKPGLGSQHQRALSAPSNFIIAFGQGWFTPLSEPVRLPIGLHARLQQTEAAVHGETPVTFAYYRWLNEPVRLKPGLRSDLQQFYTSDTIAFSNRNYPTWFAPLSTPVRVPRRVAWQQPITQDYTVPSPAASLQGWYNWWSEPKRFKRGLSTATQPFVFFGPPNIVQATLAGTETKDVLSATIYTATTLSGAIVSIIEIAPIYANTSTSYPAMVFANVSIIEIEV